MIGKFLFKGELRLYINIIIYGRPAITRVCFRILLKFSIHDTVKYGLSVKQR